MAKLLGFAAILFGVAGLVLTYTGMGAAVPGFAAIPFSTTGYIVVAVVGAVIAMYNRQTAD